jgi:hypothetical protein
MLRLDDFHPAHLNLAQVAATGRDADVVNRDDLRPIVGVGEQEEG